MLDVVPTILEDEDVHDLSGSSDDEVEFQPSKVKANRDKGFAKGFAFSYIGNTLPSRNWDDVSKYVKRKCSTKLDDKILAVRRELALEKSKLLLKNDGVDDDDDNDDDVNAPDINEDDELTLSEDELVDDKIKIKESKKKKKKKESRMDLVDCETVEKMEFEDAPPFDENASFYEMNLSVPLLKAISSMNFTHPTPIQSATIPVALTGRDICGCAATGTGKTAAYMLPTVERLLFRPCSKVSVTRVLVLVPTRELGVQVYQVTRQLAQFTSIEVGLSVGGLDLKVQEAVLRKHPDIVIATPGRLIDHLKNTPSFTLEHVEVLVLDEADRMLDEYFHEQMAEIIRACSRTRQTLLFSATMTEAVNALAAVSLSKPIKIFVDNNQTVAVNLRQEFIRIRKEREGDREPILAALVCRTFREHVMVFVQTKKQAHRLHVLLGLLGVKVGELHGDLTQAQRLEALRKFKEEEIDVLVATDVAARGLDIRGVQTVINFVLPPTMEHYIHRVGRTARAGKSGVSISLAGEPERKLVKKIIRQSRNSVKERLVIPDILDKYRSKVSQLDERVRCILQEEWEDRALAKAEAQASKTEKMLKGTDDSVKREWFQSHKERLKEKESLRLEELPSDKRKNNLKTKGNEETKSKKKNKNAPRDTAEERAEREMQKVALLQARIAKSKKRPKKMKAMVDTISYPVNFSKAKKSRKKSVFDKDLTDVSKCNVKRIRHEATHVQNQTKFKRKS